MLTACISGFTAKFYSPRKKKQAQCNTVVRASMHSVLAGKRADLYKIAFWHYVDNF